MLRSDTKQMWTAERVQHSLRGSCQAQRDSWEQFPRGCYMLPASLVGKERRHKLTWPMLIHTTAREGPPSSTGPAKGLTRKGELSPLLTSQGVPLAPRKC